MVSKELCIALGGRYGERRNRMNSPIVFRMNGVGDWILLGALLFWFVCNYLG